MKLLRKPASKQNYKEKMMSKFDEAIKKKGNILGSRKINSDEALGVNFKDAENIRLAEVRLDSLEINPYQPRTSMDEVKLEELKNSILERGLLQPIIVCPLESNPKRFQIIAGHRRTEATKRLGREYISAIIVKNQTEDLKIDALIENIQRDDLSPFDVAFAIKRIMNESNFKQVDIAKMLGKTKGYVSQLLKLCELPEDIIKHQEKNQKLPMSLLIDICYVEDKDVQAKVFEKACKEDFSRAELRAIIDELSSPKQKEGQSNADASKPFVYKANAKSVSFKLNLNEKSSYGEAIEALEGLLKLLKTSKV